jgi:hypothetical protein
MLVSLVSTPTTQTQPPSWVPVTTRPLDTGTDFLPVSKAAYAACFGAFGTRLQISVAWYFNPEWTQ